MSTTVKHFHSAMSGAPVLSGTAGALIAVLDACLVNGFGLKTADSVVVSGGIATATFSTGHSFEPDVIALVTGATPAGLNGEKTVLTTSTNTNTITFDATGIADGAATGTITVKLAPAGWDKPFAGTNLGAYRSQDVTSTRMFLRVDDTGTKLARVVGYESMSDVNIGLRPFPTPSQIAGGGYWPKSNASDPSARVWTLFADGTGFSLHMHAGTNAPGSSGFVWGFGDFDSYKSGDPFACELVCAVSDTTGALYADVSSKEYVGINNPPGPFAPRSFTGLGGSMRLSHTAESHFSVSGVSGIGGNAHAPRYPNGPDNALILSRKLLVEPGVALRGVQRGILVSPQPCHTSFAWRDKVAGQGALAGRTLMAVKCGSSNSLDSMGVVFIDITGPWG